MTEAAETPSTSPSFDLETYISRYEPASETRLQRLLFLGHHFHGAFLAASADNHHGSPAHAPSSSAAVHYERLACQAFQMAVDQMKETGNWRRYLEEFGAVLANTATSGTINNNADTGSGNAAAAGGDGRTADPESTTAASPLRSRSDSHHQPQGQSLPQQGIPHHQHPILYHQTYDPAFPAQAKRESQARLETLEARLATAQSHLTKDSIRTALLALGEFHKRRGELREAWRRVWKSREYVIVGGSSMAGGSGGGAEMIQISLLLIELGVDLRDWAKVHDTIARIEHTSLGTSSSSNNPDNASDSLYRSKLRAAQALTQLSSRNYLEAAKLFASTSIDLTNQFSNVISAEDIATYGALLGLATFHRKQLHEYILDGNFKARLELVPTLRTALMHYSRAEYGPCLKILGEAEKEWILDIHLHHHLGGLMDRIRDRCIVQYFTPYSSASLVTMGKVFGCGVEEMEAMVCRLLSSAGDGNGVNNAVSGEDGAGTSPNDGRSPTLLGEGVRINALDKTLCVENRRSVEKRARRRARVMAAKMGMQFERNAEAMLLRMACLENGLVIPGESRRGGRSNRIGARHHAANAERAMADQNMGQIEHVPYNNSDTSEDEDEDNVMMEVEDYDMNIGYQNDF
mmetsp:Transcript_4465/g.8242  ORF Transcript_4465/g.8242 Transcript_4465/m.8242 type:complete len:633 (-) Transcript_4465:168-2066(-)